MPIENLKFDFSSLPETIDIIHLGLAIIIFLQLVLLVVLLSFLVISLVRKSKNTALPANNFNSTHANNNEATPAPEPQRATETVVLKESTPEAALQLLGLLQQEARFVDFVEEDVSKFSDAEIGAAARVVHEGCKKALRSHFDFGPVRSEEENSRVTLAKGFNASEIRLTGNIVGQAPFNGTLVHKGWQVTNVKLPRLADSHNVNIIAAAEVEL